LIDVGGTVSGFRVEGEKLTFVIVKGGKMDFFLFAMSNQTRSMA
jgi:hypothetical protein